MLPRCFRPFRAVLRRATLSALIAVIATLTLTVAVASAQEEDGIMPLFGDGKLTIEGAGFKPGEKVTIAAKVESRSYQFSATADANGTFRVVTNVAVKPGESVELNARGDMGSGKASITSVPPFALPPAGAAATRFETILAAGALLLVLGGVLLAARKFRFAR